MQRKEGRKHIRPNRKGRRKRLEAKANKEKESNDLFTYYMHLWYDYVNACNSMYAEYIKYTTKMTESWFDSFSKFWSVQNKDKSKVE
jgi:hypothetical protein